MTELTLTAAGCCLLFFGLLALIALVTGLRIANEYERFVVFRLGRVKGIRGPGLFWIIPFGFERTQKVDLRVITVAMEAQESITKDSVTVKVNAVVWLKIVDPVKSVVDVADYYQASYQVALTSLRNIIGQHVLDEVLKERDTINEALRAVVDDATEPWGVQVQMVEMKDVEIPSGMQRAMAQEAQAMREKRARLIKAEAEQEASIKLAEASRAIAENPLALELRRMQMITEVGAEQNTTTIIMMPSEFTTLAESIASKFRQPDTAAPPPAPQPPAAQPTPAPPPPAEPPAPAPGV